MVTAFLLRFPHSESLCAVVVKWSSETGAMPFTSMIVTCAGHTPIHSQVCLSRSLKDPRACATEGATVDLRHRGDEARHRWCRNAAMNRSVRDAGSGNGILAIASGSWSEDSFGFWIPPFSGKSVCRFLMFVSRIFSFLPFSHHLNNEHLSPGSRLWGDRPKNECERHLFISASE